MGRQAMASVIYNGEKTVIRKEVKQVKAIISLVDLITGMKT
jgi:hypothetical protein